MEGELGVCLALAVLCHPRSHSWRCPRATGGTCSCLGVPQLLGSHPSSHACSVPKSETPRASLPSIPVVPGHGGSRGAPGGGDLLHLPGFFLRSGDAGLQAELVPGLHRPEMGTGHHPLLSPAPGDLPWPHALAQLATGQHRGEAGVAGPAQGGTRGGCWDTSVHLSRPLLHVGEERLPSPL